MTEKQNRKHGWKWVPVYPGLLMLLLFCGKSETETRAFYYWKTQYDLTESDHQTLSSLGINTLYVRFFDIAWDNGRARPVSPVAVAESAFIPKTVVPVVFITNETFAKMEPAQVAGLAHNTVEEVFHLAQLFPGAIIPQVQMDCDWTPRTRERYFGFLGLVDAGLKKKQESVLLSATIRLHQIRHQAENGVPPVDRGVLMAYHTTAPTTFSEKNSILDVDLVNSYLKTAQDYPLALDPAMPIFSWAIQYDSNRKFIRLLHRVDPAALEDGWEKVGPGLFQARADTFLADKRMMNGDLVKLEANTLSDLNRLARILSHRAEPGGTVLLFHYDSDHIARLTQDDPLKLEELLAVF